MLSGLKSYSSHALVRILIHIPFTIRPYFRKIQSSVSHINVAGNDGFAIALLHKFNAMLPHIN